MKMKDVMRLFHVSEGSLRYYEKMGIIHPLRDKNGYRVFDFDSLVNLIMCQKYNSFGLTYKDSIKSIKENDFDTNIRLFREKLNENEIELQKLKMINNYYQSVLSEMDYYKNNVITVMEIPEMYYYEIEKGDFINSIDAFEDEGIKHWLRIYEISDFEIWGFLMDGKFKWKRVFTVRKKLIENIDSFKPVNGEYLPEVTALVKYITIQNHDINAISSAANELLEYGKTIGYSLSEVIRAKIVMNASNDVCIKLYAEIVK